MCFKLGAFLVILVMMTIHLARSAPFEVTPILHPNELGNKCLVLPEVSDSTFELLVKKNCYVDKTEYLMKMLSRTQTFWFLSRPRRFGKTLLVGVLEALFAGKNELFKGTAIYQQLIGSLSNFNIKSIRWPKYPLIRLDFSDGISVDAFSKFEADTLFSLRSIAKSNDIHLDAPNVPSVTKELIESLYKKYNKKVVVLIDEYDAPYTGMYAADKNEASRVLRTLQSFFKTLKAQVDHIRFSFTTGITRLALSDFFSGANAAVDLTMNPDYAGILGFTENELTQYFGDYIKNVAIERKNSTENILNEMRKWHDGFRFTSKNESLFSPISVIGYLRSGGDLRSYSDTAGSSQVFIERLRTFPQDAAELLINDVVNGEADETKKKMAIIADKEELSGEYNFDDLTDSTALVVFLFHSGYLSVRGFEHTTYKTEYTLGFSNLELKRDFENHLAFSLTGVRRRQRDKVVKSMVQNLAKHEWKPFILNLESFLCRVPFQFNVYQRKNIEALFHITLHVILLLCADPLLYQTQPLMEVPTNKGCADIVVTIGGTTFIFEPKMESDLENPVYECKVRYLHAHLYNYDSVLCFGIKFIFSGHVHSWGIAKFSKEGKLIEEDGNILLTTQFDAREKENITNQLKDFKMKHPNFTLQSEELIEFLEQIGPTIKDEGLFARKFTTDIETLCTFLSINENLFEPNLKSAIKTFVKRNASKKEKDEGKKGKKGDKW